MPAEETSPKIEEVRDEAYIEIISDPTHGPVLQGVIDRLSCPCDKQLVRVNKLMAK